MMNLGVDSVKFNDVAITQLLRHNRRAALSRPSRRGMAASWSEHRNALADPMLERSTFGTRCGVLKDALEGFSITITDFAAHLGVARSTINRVLSRKAGITPDI